MNYLVVIVAYFGFNEKRRLLSNARDNKYYHLFSSTEILYFFSNWYKRKQQDAVIVQLIYFC